MAQAARLSLRMQKELKLLMTDPPPGVSLPLLSGSDSSSSSSLSTIEARIEGPEGTVYSKGVFNIKIQIPERYPFQPPSVTFLTPIYHPNIDNGGRICLDILNLPPKGAWQPSLNISTVLTSIGLLLSEPNPDDGLMAETSKEYKYNRQAFDQKARSWTEKYANIGAIGENNGGVSSMNIGMAQMETKRAATLSDNLIIDSEVRKKRLCLTGEQPSRKSMTQAEKNMNNKENVAPTRRLSISRPANTPMVGSSSSVLLELGTEYCDRRFLNKDNNDIASDEIMAVAKSLKNSETIIVSDSEESDEESDRPPKRRLALMHKNMLGRFAKK